MGGLKRWMLVVLIACQAIGVAQTGDAAMATEQARMAQKQFELGVAQKDYPLFR